MVVVYAGGGIPHFLDDRQQKPDDDVQLKKCEPGTTIRDTSPGKGMSGTGIARMKSSPRVSGLERCGGPLAGECDLVFAFSHPLAGFEFT